MKKYESNYDMLNQVAAEYWIYGEYGDGFGTPQRSQRHSLSQSGRKIGEPKVGQVRPQIFGVLRL